MTRCREESGRCAILPSPRTSRGTRDPTTPRSSRSSPPITWRHTASHLTAQMPPASRRWRGTASRSPPSALRRWQRSREAERYFEDAAGLADDALTRAELLERAGESARAGARLERAEALFEQSIVLLESEGALHPAARVSARLGDVLFSRDRLQEAIARMEGAYGVFSTRKSPTRTSPRSPPASRAHTARPAKSRSRANASSSRSRSRSL